MILLRWAQRPSSLQQIKDSVSHFSATDLLDGEYLSKMLHAIFTRVRAIEGTWSEMELCRR